MINNYENTLTDLIKLLRFYLEWQIAQAPSGQLDLSTLAQGFPLPCC